MVEKKLTKCEMFEQIKAVKGLTEEQVKFIDHEIELLTKKNSSKKLTAAQKVNEDIKAEILEVMEPDKRYTIGELMKVVPTLVEIGATNQKTSQLVRQLRDAGLVTRSEEKGKAYFSKV